MPDVVLATLNAKYAHAAFGLRYLYASLGALRERAVIRELTIQDRPVDVVEQLLALAPRIVGLGVYIWNAKPMLEVVTLLKRLRPDVIVVLGGPEVSYEHEQQELVRLADFVVTGEGEEAFAKLAHELLSGARPGTKVIPGGLPNLETLSLPYDEYATRDLGERVIYVEASRGCPFSCEFCLSSLDEKVRAFPLDAFLGAMDQLWQRGLRHYKFVDRTFNLSPKTSAAILEFFLARVEPGTFVHFEMIPDRLPEALRGLLARFPPGTVQLEIGVQTFDPEVSRRISRRQDMARLEDNFRFLRAETGVHVHADLIVGLPGETLEAFGRGFDRLLALRPQEIQVGILKRLRGTPIVRHDAEYRMVYNPEPPYELLENSTLDFVTLQRMKRFARYWDIVVNNGHLPDSVPLLFRDASPFSAFLAFSDWLFERTGKAHAMALERLIEFMFEYLTQVRGQDATAVREALARDYARGGRRLPDVLRSAPSEKSRPTVPKRQARHLRAQS